MAVELADVVMVAGGGALGGMGRLAVGNAAARWRGTAFPWGTLAVNLSGALAMGLLAGLLGVPAVGEAGPAWSFAAVGLLGGYTTVSSLSLQTLMLWRQGRRAATLGYGLGTLGAGLAALWLGASLAGGLS